MMRKLLLLALMCSPFLLVSQAERTVLIEEWTNASCGPCASQNPEFNTLLDENSDQILDIKYQWYFPGFDPMHNQNPDEANNRGSYYGLSGVPTAWIDGALPGPTYAGGAGTWQANYHGGPYGYTNGVIDWAADQSTPIEMTVVATITEDLSEVSAEVTITNIGDADFVMADGRLHVVLIEREITFTSAPGTNGEKEFINVMRKMYPDENGTTVAMIPAGGSATFTVTGAVPSYIYNDLQLRMVAFVQDHTSTEVWQAAEGVIDFYSDYTLSSAVENITGLPASICSGENTIVPSFKLINTGNETLTSADIVYSVNGGAEQTLAWTGSLQTQEDISVGLDPITFEAVSGVNVIDIRTENPNGGTDDYETDNAIQGVIDVAPSSTNIIELTLVTDNYGNETYWQLTNSAGTVVASGGNPAVGLTLIGVGGGTAPAGGYGNNQTVVEEIEIDSDDCYTFTITDYYGDGICCAYGNGSYTLRDQDGNMMYSNGEFPAREDSPIVGEFVVGVEELTEVTELSLFPNPVKETLNVRFSLEEASQLQVEVFNATGQRVQSLGAVNYSTGQNQLDLNAATLPNGVYFLRMYNADRELNRRFVVQH